MFSSAKQLLARANRRGLRRAVAALAMVAFWCIGPVSALATPTVVARANLAPGVSYRRIDDPTIPIHTYVLAGRMMQTGKRVGVSFGFRQDETGGMVGRHPIRISAVDESTGASVQVK